MTDYTADQITEVQIDMVPERADSIKLLVGDGGSLITHYDAYQPSGWYDEAVYDLAREALALHVPKVYTIGRGWKRYYGNAEALAADNSLPEPLPWMEPLDPFIVRQSVADQIAQATASTAAIGNKVIFFVGASKPSSDVGASAVYNEDTGEFEADSIAPATNFPDEVPNGQRLFFRFIKVGNRGGGYLPDPAPWDSVASMDSIQYSVDGSTNWTATRDSTHKWMQFRINGGEWIDPVPIVAVQLEYATLADVKSVFNNPLKRISLPVSFSLDYPEFRVRMEWREYADDATPKFQGESIVSNAILTTVLNTTGDEASRTQNKSSILFYLHENEGLAVVRGVLGIGGQTGMPVCVEGESQAVQVHLERHNSSNADADEVHVIQTLQVALEGVGSTRIIIEGKKLS